MEARVLERMARMFVRSGGNDFTIKDRESMFQMGVSEFGNTVHQLISAHFLVYRVGGGRRDRSRKSDVLNVYGWVLDRVPPEWKARLLNDITERLAAAKTLSSAIDEETVRRLERERDQLEVELGEKRAQIQVIEQVYAKSTARHQDIETELRQLRQQRVVSAVEFLNRLGVSRNDSEFFDMLKERLAR